MNQCKALGFALLFVILPMHAAPLTCSMTLENRQQTQQDSNSKNQQISAIIRFTLTNTSTESMLFLPWNTPWEGWKGRFLEVTLNGEKLEYQGPMIKRGAPQKSDFINLQPNQTLTNSLNLARVYELGTGKYQISYTGLLTAKSYEESEQSNTIQHFETNCPTLEFEL